MKTALRTTLAAASLILASALASCAGGSQAAEPEVDADGIRTEVKLAIGENNPVWDTFKRVAEQEHGIDVELVSFQDWNLPNQALVNGEVDANAFQHVQFLSEFNVANDAELRPVGVTSLGTMGIYSASAASLEEIPDGSKILLPNDPTNQARALLLLERQGLIQLDPNTGTFSTIDDVVDNPHRFEFTPLVAQQIAQSLQDAGAGVAYQSAAVKAGIDKNSVLATDLDLVHEPGFLPYQAVFAARAEDQDDPTWKVLEEIYHSDAVKRAYDEENQGLGVLSRASLQDLLKVQEETEAKLRSQ